MRMVGAATFKKIYTTFLTDFVDKSSGLSIEKLLLKEINQLQPIL